MVPTHTQLGDVLRPLIVLVVLVCLVSTAAGTAAAQGPPADTPGGPETGEDNRLEGQTAATERSGGNAFNGGEVGTPGPIL